MDDGREEEEDEELTGEKSYVNVRIAYLAERSRKQDIG